MITIEPSVTSYRAFNDLYMQALQQWANEQFVLPGATIYIHMSKDMADGEFNLWAVYPSLFSEKPNKKIKVGNMQDVFTDATSAINEILYTALKQIDCHANDRHHWQRSKDKFNNTFDDGRANCEHCGVYYEKALEPKPGKPIVRMGLGDDYVAQYDWECPIQAGDRGIVFSVKNGGCYNTAFFEASPTVGEVRTFIRGEGENVHSAETACYERYQKRLACTGHEWSRNVNGNERDDGYAICTHCGLTGSVLDPLTICIVCEKPTTKRFAGKHICHIHYFAKSDAELLQEFIAQDSKMKISEDEQVHEQLDFLLDLRLMRAAYLNVSNATFEQHHHAFQSYVRQTMAAIKSTLFGLKPFSDFTADHDIDSPDIQACIDYVGTVTPQLVKRIEGDIDKEHRFPLLPEHFR